MSTYAVLWGCGGYEAKGLTFVAALDKAKQVIARGAGRGPVDIVNLDEVDLGREDGLTEDEREDVEHVIGRDWRECQTCGKCFVEAEGDGQGEACIDCIEAALEREERRREPDDDWKAKYDRE